MSECSSYNSSNCQSYKYVCRQTLMFGFIWSGCNTLLQSLQDNSLCILLLKSCVRYPISKYGSLVQIHVYVFISCFCQPCIFSFGVYILQPLDYQIFQVLMLQCTTQTSIVLPFVLFYHDHSLSSLLSSIFLCSLSCLYLFPFISCQF